MVRNLIGKILRKLRYKKIPENIGVKKDEFFRWISFAIPGMTGGGNIESLGYAIKNLKGNGAIIEIGSFCGLSTIIISYFKNQFKKTNTLYTCDKWEFEGQQMGKMIGNNTSMKHEDYRNFVKETYIRNVTNFCKNDLPHTIEVFSDDFFKEWTNNSKKIDVLGKEVTLGGPIAFAFIDGNHTYEFAKRDFINVDKFLEKDGFVLLDDSSDYSRWEVNKVAREILKMKNYELVARNPNYLFKKIL